MFFDEAAAGDVRNAVHVAGFAGCQRGLDVDFVGVSRVSPQLFPLKASTGAFRSRSAVGSTSLAAPENSPLECTPEEAMPHQHRSPLRHALAGDGFLPARRGRR